MNTAKNIYNFIYIATSLFRFVALSQLCIHDYINHRHSVYTNTIQEGITISIEGNFLHIQYHSKDISFLIEQAAPNFFYLHRELECEERKYYSSKELFFYGRKLFVHKVRVCKTKEEALQLARSVLYYRASII